MASNNQTATGSSSTSTTSSSSAIPTKATTNAEEQANFQGTICEDDERAQDIDLNKQRQIELEEEKKLKARHPCIQRPGSEFLQKRLQRGQKYFDSGDYNMAKASTNSTIKLPDNATPVTAIDSKLLNKRH